MRRVHLLLAILLVATPPALAAQTFTWDVSSLACVVQGQVVSPSATYRCTIAASVSLVLRSCDAQGCTYDTHGSAIFTAVVPSFPRVAAGIAGESPVWTCDDQSTTLASGAGCSGSTSGHAIALAAGQCRGLSVVARGGAAPAPLAEAPDVLAVSATRAFDLCRNAAGDAFVSG